MKKRSAPAKLFFFLVAMLFIAAAGSAQDPEPWSINTSPLPAPTGFVNDYAGVIDAQTKQQLEKKLKDLKDTTGPSVEIAVVVVKTTGGRPIEDYSIAVARGWKIGSKEDDNPSALLLVAIDDRKYFTQISKDLEDDLPDGVVGSLQRKYLVPEFKQGNYGKGISDTIDAYIATIRNKGAAPTARQTPAAERPSGGGGFPFFGVFCCGLIILVILLIIFGRSRGGPTKGDRDRWGGGGFGGGGGSGGDILPAIIGGLIGSALSGGGSSSSSWGGSSDSGSSGGFGGFGGGGDFGGGGAGGDW